MAYKLLDAAQEHWRRFNGHKLVTSVRAGVRYMDGVLAPDEHQEAQNEKAVA